MLVRKQEHRSYYRSAALHTTTSLLSSRLLPRRGCFNRLAVLSVSVSLFTRLVGYLPTTTTAMANPMTQRGSYSNLSSSSSLNNLSTNGSSSGNHTMINTTSVSAASVDGRGGASPIPPVVPLTSVRSFSSSSSVASPNYESLSHHHTVSPTGISSAESADLAPTMRTTRVSWPDVQKYIPLVPPLRENVWYKGQNGKVAVVGGSESYTGAPYFAAQASLRFGADLATVFCAREAAVPIKAYSPDLIVTPIYDRLVVEQHSRAVSGEERFKIAQEAARVVLEQLPKMHSLVIGPGLGRSAFLGDLVEVIVRHARSRKIPIVIDADALHLIASRLPVIIGYDRCILTPNGHEIIALVNAAIATLEDMKREVSDSSGDVTVLFPTPAPAKLEEDGHVAEYSIDDALKDLKTPSDAAAQLRALSLALGGVAVLLKGKEDLLTAGERVFVVTDLDGTSPRRCGGQGDILSGTLGTALYWAVANLQPERVATIERRIKSSIAVAAQRSQTSGGGGTSSSPVDAGPSLEHVPELLRKPILAGAVLASTVTRKAAWNAFSVHRRATTTSEILGSIGRAFEAVSPEELH